MTGKDILTLLLVIYGFKDIKIKTYGKNERDTFL